jgi:hypothetical protein
MCRKPPNIMWSRKYVGPAKYVGSKSAKICRPKKKISKRGARHPPRARRKQDTTTRAQNNTTQHFFGGLVFLSPLRSHPPHLPTLVLMIVGAGGYCTWIEGPPLCTPIIHLLLLASCQDFMAQALRHYYSCKEYNTYPTPCFYWSSL